MFAPSLPTNSDRLWPSARNLAGIPHVSRVLVSHALVSHPMEKTL